MALSKTKKILRMFKTLYQFLNGLHPTLPSCGVHRSTCEPRELWFSQVSLFSQIIVRFLKGFQNLGAMRGHPVESGWVQANDVKSLTLWALGPDSPAFGARPRPSFLAIISVLSAVLSFSFELLNGWFCVRAHSWDPTTKRRWERYFLVFFFFFFMEGTLKWRASALPEIWPALHLSGNKVHRHADWSFTSHKLQCNDNNEGTNGLTVLRWRVY